MIANTTLGKGFRGVLGYVMEKNNAEVIGSQFLLSDVFNSSANEISQEFRQHIEDNKRLLHGSVKNVVDHTSISFAIGENISNEMMLDIAHEYMQKKGYENSQYIVVRHNDTEHQHFHIVANRVDLDVKIVDDSFNYYENTRITTELELKYNLVQSNPITEQKQKGSAEQKKPEPQKTKKQREMDMRNAIHETVSKTILDDSRNINTIYDLKSELQKEGIDLQIKEVKGEVKGISFATEKIKVSGTKCGLKTNYLLAIIEEVKNKREKEVSTKSNTVIEEKTEGVKVIQEAKQQTEIPIPLPASDIKEIQQQEDENQVSISKNVDSLSLTKDLNQDLDKSLEESEPAKAENQANENQSWNNSTETQSLEQELQNLLLLQNSNNEILQKLEQKKNSNEERSKDKTQELTKSEQKLESLPNQIQTFNDSESLKSKAKNFLSKSWSNLTNSAKKISTESLKESTIDIVVRLPKLNERLKELKPTLSELPQKLSNEQKSLEKELKELEQKLDSNELTLKSKTQELTILEIETHSLEKELKDLEKAKKEEFKKEHNMTEKEYVLNTKIMSYNRTQDASIFWNNLRPITNEGVKIKLNNQQVEGLSKETTRLLLGKFKPQNFEQRTYMEVVQRGVGLGVVKQNGLSR